MTTVVIIEDEANIRTFISANLSIRGYAVLQAESGEAGLQLLRKTSPDALILDMLLPGMNGAEVLGAMSEDEHLRAIPVILMTASVNTGDLNRYPNLVQRLVKPASVNVLMQAVEMAIR